MKQPEALRLADELDKDRNWLAKRHTQAMAEAAAELRRLHGENAKLKEELERVCSHGARDQAGYLRGLEDAKKAVDTRWPNTRYSNAIDKLKGGE